MTRSVIAWPGHMSEISRNQPSLSSDQQLLPSVSLQEEGLTLDGGVNDFSAHFEGLSCLPYEGSGMIAPAYVSLDSSNQTTLPPAVNGQHPLLPALMAGALSIV